MMLFLHYFWMALYFLIAVAVVVFVNSAFRLAIVARFPAVEHDHPVLSGIANVVISLLLFWLAFSYESLLWGTAATLALLVLVWFRFNGRWLRIFMGSN
jgi:hypothetical protein